jgi:hypothetical protein
MINCGVNCDNCECNSEVEYSTLCNCVLCCLYKNRFNYLICGRVITC